MSKQIMTSDNFDFDPEFYLATYPDIAEAGVDPRHHYFTQGIKEGRLPCRPKELDSWQSHGVVARDALENDFDPEFYLATYPDIAEAGVDPRHHYFTQGIKEGRIGSQRLSALYEAWLWRGVRVEALNLLRQLAKTGDANDRCAAVWALARWHGAKGAWSECVCFLERLGELTSKSGAFPGQYLLGVNSAVALRDIERARRFAEEAQIAFGLCSDVYLAQAAVDLAFGADESCAAQKLRQLFESEALSPPYFLPTPGPLIDRLACLPNLKKQSNPYPLPLVTVILPVFNAEATLDTAVRSILSQSWTAIELVIVDDGSTDSTPQLLNSYLQSDPRVRVLRHERNSGVYSARNTGLDAARGEFLTVHDADDWSHPEKISRQVAHLLNNKRLLATFSHHVRVTPDLQPTRWRMEDTWVFRNMSSMLFRREVFSQIGYWDRVKGGADTEYLERIVRVFGHAVVADVLPGTPLSFVRMTDGSLSQRSEAPIETQLEGPRRDYMLAARRWHASIATSNDAFLSREPEKRPFRAPHALAVDAQPPASLPRDVVSESSFFDSVWYLSSYPEARSCEAGAAEHYVQNWAAGFYDPGPKFSTSAYLQLCGAGLESPLVHWHLEGKEMGVELPLSFQGKLDSATSKRPILVFGHSAQTELFGAERSMLTLLEDVLACGGVPVAVLPHIHSRDYLDELRVRSARVWVLPYAWRNGTREDLPETVNAIRELIRAVNPTEVCVNSCVLRAPLIAARAEGVKSVMFLRELLASDNELGKSLAIQPENLRQAFLREADRFLVPSQAVAEWLDVSDRAFLLPNRVSHKLFTMSFTPRIPLRVGLVGNIVPKKGLDDMIALAALLRDNSTVELKIVGPIPEGMTGHTVQGLSFTGYKASTEEAIECVDIVLNLSRVDESFGRTVLEAQAAGRPVICYRGGAIPELVVDGKSGNLIERGDVGAVSQAITAFADNPERLFQYSLAARENACALQRQSIARGMMAF
jgi:glycosyltransferase involved in cell wall biosynthesis